MKSLNNNLSFLEKPLQISEMIIVHQHNICHSCNDYYLQILASGHLSNDTQKQIELQRRQQEQLLQQHQKLQELHGQLTAQYAAASNPALSRQGLMFLPYFEQLRGLQQVSALSPTVPKSPLENHVSMITMQY